MLIIILAPINEKIRTLTGQKRRPKCSPNGNRKEICFTLGKFLQPLGHTDDLKLKSCDEENRGVKKTAHPKTFRDLNRAKKSLI